jgi:multiple sugar transport system permease protein
MSDRVGTVPPAGLERPSRRHATRSLGALTPYLLIAPTVIFMVVFFVWPLIDALLLAFRSSAGAWTLANVQGMLSDLNFVPALVDTLLLLLFIIPIELGLALVAAVVTQQRPRGQALFLYLWSIPLAVSDLAAGLVWLAVFTSHGFLNSALQGLHLIAAPIGFLDYDNLAGLVLAVVAAEVWRSISLVMVVILSGLQAIPKEVLEAAESLGAGGWRRFWHVTAPLLKPTIQVALIMRTTTAFTVFASVLALGGGTFHILAGESFHQVQNQNYQLAAAYGVLILFLSSLATTGYLIVLRTRREVFGR